MELTIKMPTCLAPRLIDIKVSVGDCIALGDLLFSYESDGALMFEYSACSGVVAAIHASATHPIRIGDPILTVHGSPMACGTDAFKT